MAPRCFRVSNHRRRPVFSKINIIKVLQKLTDKLRRISTTRDARAHTHAYYNTPYIFPLPHHMLFFPPLAHTARSAKEREKREKGNRPRRASGRKQQHHRTDSARRKCESARRCGQVSCGWGCVPRRWCWGVLHPRLVALCRRLLRSNRQHPRLPRAAPFRSVTATTSTMTFTSRFPPTPSLTILVRVPSPPPK